MSALKNDFSVFVSNISNFRRRGIHPHEGHTTVRQGEELKNLVKRDLNIQSYYYICPVQAEPLS